MIFDDWVHLNWWESEAWLNLQKALMSKQNTLPPPATWYRALELTPFNEVKCVILGQDPYHTPGLAHGLSFSVPANVNRLPPSLRNIFKEYVEDTGYPWPRNGDLTPWAERGVLLLNSVLTVEAGKPFSHAGMGWEKLTVEVIQKLSEYRKHVVYIFWGRKAQEYAGLVDERFNHIIIAPHPSPYAVNTGFFGHRPFTRTNEALTLLKEEPINWRL